MQRFSFSDNHNELGSNLDSLKSLGLNPYLSFSNDPGRDETLIKLNFSNLRNLSNNINEFTEPISDDLAEIQCGKLIKYICLN